MMVKKIEQYFQYFGVAPKIQEVSLKVLPADIQKLDIPVTPHNSYKTAADYVLNLHELGFEELHYVHIHVKWILYFPCKTTVQDDSEVMPDCDIVHSAELL